MMPEKVPEEPKLLSFARANPWVALPMEVHVDIASWDRKVRGTTESPLDGQDRPKIYDIRDHTLKVLMHQLLLELHAVRVLPASHGNEQQLHFKMQVMCGPKEVVADVMVHSGAQVRLVRNGLFPATCLKSSDRPVRLKVAKGRIMGAGAREAELGVEFFEDDRLDQLDQAKRLMLDRKLYEADLPACDIIYNGL